MDNIKNNAALLRALSEGRVEDYTRLVGRPFSFTGEIIHGLGKGKTVGMPTCNFDISNDPLLPKDAVYQTLITIDGVAYRSLTSIGPRPSIENGEARTLETFILDFNRDVYGKVVKLEFIKYIRDIVKLKNLEEVRDKVLEDITLMI